MEIPIHVAVRILPDTQMSKEYIEIISPSKNIQNDDYEAEIATAGIIKVEGRAFPVTHVLPIGVTQGSIFSETVYPLIQSFMEGYDVSIVTYGQTGTGKTYTLYGPGFDCIYGESEQGIVQRCLRDIFTHISNQPDRNYMISIGWIELESDQVRDLLHGMVQISSVGEAFECLRIGMANKISSNSHTSLSMTLEQKWISPEGLIQHRLSTISFCDLCGTQRYYLPNNKNYYRPKDAGLHHLEGIISSLTDVTQIFNNTIDYAQNPLTTMLKDSFGGRAQTLMFLCISPLREHVTETIVNLQFAYQVQLVRNYVVLNTFSDNNTPLNLNAVQEHDVDTFGLQFAASQWLKLVSNAEGLFRNLITRKTLTEQDLEQIEEWMFLKAECEECLSSGDMNVGEMLRPLVPIQEADEMDEENGNQGNSDGESDICTSHRPNLIERIESLMDEFRVKTDNLVEMRHNDFHKNHPIAVSDSYDSFLGADETKSLSRRKSILPGSSLSSADIAKLEKAADRENGNHCSPNRDEFLESPTENVPIRKQAEALRKKIILIGNDIDASRRQIKEIEYTVKLKQKLVADLISNNDTTTKAHQRFHKKRYKLELEYEKTKKALTKAIMNGNKMEIDRLKHMTADIETRLHKLAPIENIAGENGHTVKKLQKALQESQKQLEKMQKSVKKQIKTKENLENKLKEERLREKDKGLSTLGRGKKNLKDVAVRISHLDLVLKEKSQTLEDNTVTSEKESLRHEIRNLRSSKDDLIKLRCHLDKIRKKQPISQNDERKLLECDVYIEAIDYVIETKNELICGHRSIDSNEKIQREKGEQMMTTILSKLSTDEKNTFDNKFFRKVVDLRESCQKLESNVIELERERDAWEFRERVLINAVQQARLEGERHSVQLQQHYETKLTFMLRHLADETSTNSSLNDPRFLPSPSSSPLDSDFDVDFYKAGPSKHYPMQHHRQHKPNDLDMLPSSVDHLYHYRPLDKYKEKDRDMKNKLFHKIQVFTRYHGSDKRKLAAESMIPHENLKQLQCSTVPMTKVTREKNKLIIQQNPSR